MMNHAADANANATPSGVSCADWVLSSALSAPRRANVPAEVRRSADAIYVDGLVAEWSDWASRVVDDWPDDVAEALPEPAELRRIVRRAAWSKSG